MQPEGVPMSALQRAVAALGVTAFLVACDGSPSGVSASLEEDVTRLQQVLGEDPARAVLADVDQALDEERPVEAVQLMVAHEENWATVSRELQALHSRLETLPKKASVPHDREEEW